MFRHDSFHSGSVVASPPITPTVLWRVNVGLPLYSSPAIFGKSVFIGARGVLLAFDGQTGDTLWKAEMAGEIYSSPALDPKAGKQGMVYIASYGSRSSTLSAFDIKSGERIWWMWMSTKSSPTLALNISVSNDVVNIPRCSLFIGAGETLFALDADTGRTIWKFGAHGTIDSTPAVDERYVYFGTVSNIVYSLDRYTGGGIWKLELKAPIVSSPSVGRRLLIVASEDGIIYGLDKLSGRVIWTYNSSSEGRLISSPAYCDGAIYIGRGSSLIKLSEEGTLLWTVPTYGLTFSSPVVSARKVYIGSYGSDSSSIFCFDAVTGRRIWSKWMDVVSSPSAANRSLIVANLAGELYCFNDLEYTE